LLDQKPPLKQMRTVFCLGALMVDWLVKNAAHLARKPVSNLVAGMDFKEQGPLPFLQLRRKFHTKKKLSNHYGDRNFDNDERII
jgi:hypothetical protein